MMLERWIDELGVRVVERPCPQGWWGYYDPESHLIVMRPRLAMVQGKSTLAHELGHAFFKHWGTTPKQERVASEWAAQALISASDFESATRMFDSVAAVANELDVLPRDVRNYARIRQEWRADGVSMVGRDDIFQHM